MRLAVFTNMYPAQTATFFERDMRALADAGVEIEVFAIRPVDNNLWQYALKILDESRLPRNRVHHISPKEALPAATRTLRRSIRRGIGDATAMLSSALRFGPAPFAKSVYTIPQAWAWAAEHEGRFDHVLGYWGNYAATCAYLFHRMLKKPIPFSIWLHAGTDLYRTPIFMRQKLEYADNVITCCEFNREYIREHFAELWPSISRKLHVSHHGLNLDDFHFDTEGKKANHVLAVGRLAAHKGFDYLIKAAAQIIDQGHPLILEFVGDGPELENLRHLTKKLGIAPYVRFSGWLPFPEAQSAMRTATMLVHPSDGLGDGLPNVIREAMALGTPVVASNVAGIPDALKDGCGVLVPPCDPPALARAIVELLDAPDERLRIALSARERVEKKYDMKKTGQRLAAVLENTRRKEAPVSVPSLSHAPETGEARHA